jgi:hypothetical protein
MSSKLRPLAALAMSNQTDIEPASMPTVVSELGSGSYLVMATTCAQDSVGEGCLAVTQPRGTVLTDGRVAPNLVEGSPWPSCSLC